MNIYRLTTKFASNYIIAASPNEALEKYKKYFESCYLEQPAVRIIEIVAFQNKENKDFLEIYHEPD